MKKSIALLLAALLALTLAACGTSEPAQAVAVTETAPITEPTEAVSTSTTEDESTCTTEPTPDALKPYVKPYDPYGHYTGTIELIQDSMIRFDVYGPDLYPIDEVKALQVGDRIVISGAVLEIEYLHYSEKHNETYNIDTTDGHHLVLSREIIYDFDAATEIGQSVPVIYGDYCVKYDKKEVYSKIRSLECDLNDIEHISLCKGISKVTQKYEYEDITGADLAEMMNAQPSPIDFSNAECSLYEGSIFALTPYLLPQ